MLLLTPSRVAANVEEMTGNFARKRDSSGSSVPLIADLLAADLSVLMFVVERPGSSV